MNEPVYSLEYLEGFRAGYAAHKYKSTTLRDTIARLVAKTEGYDVAYPHIASAIEANIDSLQNKKVSEIARILEIPDCDGHGPSGNKPVIVHFLKKAGFVYVKVKKGKKQVRCWRLGYPNAIILPK